MKHFPACFVELPASTEGRSARFYLAVEEWVAKNLPEDNYLFTWQLAPTVVCGRNQDIPAEVNVAFCEETGVEIVRRKSGGGSIYADHNNIMVSLITGAGPVEPLFEEYADTVAETLTKLGAPCHKSGRNDITLKEGGKICGNAFYHLPTRNIVHGTMLYDTDRELMAKILTPPKEKLERHGVKSVKSRVDTLKEYLPFDVNELRRQLRLGLTDRSVTITEEQLENLEY